MGGMNGRARLTSLSHRPTDDKFHTYGTMSVLCSLPTRSLVGTIGTIDKNLSMKHDYTVVAIPVARHNRLASFSTSNLIQYI